MRWAVYVARMGSLKDLFRMLAKYLQERQHSQTLRLDERVMLKLILNKMSGCEVYITSSA